MKVLVSTNRTQGDMAGDYTYCILSELLWNHDGVRKGSSRSRRRVRLWARVRGLTSHRATTTADLDMTEADLRLAVTTSLSDQGWLPPELASENEEIVTEAIELVRTLAEPLVEGTIVRRRIDAFHAFPPRASR